MLLYQEPDVDTEVELLNDKTHRADDKDEVIKYDDEEDEETYRRKPNIFTKLFCCQFLVGKSKKYYWSGLL